MSFSAAVMFQDGFEIRHYAPTVWVSTQIEDVDYDQATNVGFHRLFDYISGNNAAAAKIPMTVRRNITQWVLQRHCRSGAPVGTRTELPFFPAARCL